MILIRLSNEVFAEILQTRRESHNVFKVMKEATTKNTLPSKALIQIQQIKNFTNKQKLRESSTTRPTLQQMLKELFLGGREKATTRLPWWLRLYRICLQCRRLRFDSWVRKIPWRRKWQPTPVFLPGESHGQRSLAATVHGVAKATVHGVAKELDTTERLSFSQETRKLKNGNTHQEKQTYSKGRKSSTHKYEIKTSNCEKRR